MEEKRKAHNEYIKAWRKRRMAESPEYREKMREYNRKHSHDYYVAHKEIVQATMIRCWANKLRRMGYTVIDPEGGAE